MVSPNPGTVTNVAAILSSTSIDTNSSNNTNSVAVTWAPTNSADLGIRLSLATNVVLQGSIVTVEFYVTNNGPAVASNIVIYAPLPPGVPIEGTAEPLPEGVASPGELLLLDARDNGVLASGDVKIDPAGAGSVVPASVVTLVSVSPATTCAAVTTRPGRATQPLPSIPSPQAVPSTRTTLGAAARTPGRLSTRGSSGCVGTGGPARLGNGSIRPSAFSSVRGGTIELRREERNKIEDVTAQEYVASQREPGRARREQV